MGSPQRMHQYFAVSQKRYKIVSLGPDYYTRLTGSRMSSVEWYHLQQLWVIRLLQIASFSKFCVAIPIFVTSEARYFKFGT